MSLSLNPQYYKALAGVKDAANYFNNIVLTLEDKLAQVDAKQKEFDSLEATYAEKLRAAEVDLALTVRANKEKAFAQLAKELGMAMVTNESYVSLQASLNKLQTEFDQQLKEATGKAFGQAKSETAAAVKEAKAEAAIAQAELAAANKQLTATVADLQSQVVFLRGEVEATRKSAVEAIAAASKNAPVFNVPTGK